MSKTFRKNPEDGENEWERRRVDRVRKLKRTRRLTEQQIIEQQMARIDWDQEKEYYDGTED